MSETPDNKRLLNAATEIARDAAEPIPEDAEINMTSTFKRWILVTRIERGALIAITALSLSWVAMHSLHSNFTTRAGMSGGAGVIIIAAVLFDSWFQRSFFAHAR